MIYSNTNTRFRGQVKMLRTPNELDVLESGANAMSSGGAASSPTGTRVRFVRVQSARRHCVDHFCQRVLFLLLQVGSLPGPGSPSSTPLRGSAAPPTPTPWSRNTANLGLGHLPIRMTTARRQLRGPARPPRCRPVWGLGTRCPTPTPLGPRCVSNVDGDTGRRRQKAWFTWLINPTTHVLLDPPGHGRW